VVTREGGTAPRDEAVSRLVMTVALLGGLGLLVAAMIDTLNLTIDDVFISFRYAENAARGLGWVFNPGERVEGFSNLSWTMLLTALARAGYTQHASPYALLVPAKLIGAACGLATWVALAAWTVRRREPGRREQVLLVLAPLVLGAGYSFGLWSISAMETPLCALFVTLAVLVQMSALRRLEAGASPGGSPGGSPTIARFVVAGLLFGLASLTRPEPVLVWALATGALAIVSPHAVRRALLVGAVPTLALYLASTAWRLHTYGAWIPNSVVAKTGGGWHSNVLGVKYAAAGLLDAVGALALAFLGLPALVRGRREWMFLALFVAAYALFVALSGGDWMPGYRLLAPFAPALILLAVASLVALVQRGALPLPAAGVALVVALLAVLSFASTRNLVRSQRAFPSGFGRVTWLSSPLRVEVAAALRDTLPPGATVALAECGVIPYYAPDLRIVDVLGLMDPTFARMPVMTAEEFLRRAPDAYLVMIKSGQPSRESLPLLASPEFHARYVRTAVFDGQERRLREIEAGNEPPLEEEQTFLLYRRRP
jgi:arabinofuranosyltransferase